MATACTTLKCRVRSYVKPHICVSVFLCVWDEWSVTWPLSLCPSRTHTHKHRTSPQLHGGVQSARPRDMGAKAQRWSMDSGSWGADKAPFRGPRPGDNGWARLSPLLHSSTQRLILQMGFPVAGKAKRRALLFVTGHCASRLRTNLLDGLDKWEPPLTVNRLGLPLLFWLWSGYNQVIWALGSFCFSLLTLLTPKSHLNRLGWLSCDLSPLQFPLLFVVTIYRRCIEGATARGS